MGLGMFLRLNVGRVELSDSEFKDCSAVVRTSSCQCARSSSSSSESLSLERPPLQQGSEGKRGRSGACQETHRVFSLACGLSR